MIINYKKGKVVYNILKNRRKNKSDLFLGKKNKESKQYTSEVLVDHKKVTSTIKIHLFKAMLVNANRKYKNVIRGRFKC